jgi:hypothetical protein
MPQTRERQATREVTLTTLLAMLSPLDAAVIPKLLREDTTLTGVMLYESPLGVKTARVIGPRSEYLGHLRSREQAERFRIRDGVEDSDPRNWWLPRVYARR